MKKRADLLGALKAGWWLIPVVFAASLGGAAFFGSEQEPLYRAAATLAAVPHPEVEDHGDVFDAVQVLERRTMVATLSRIVSSTSIREAATEDLGLSGDDVRRYRVNATVVPNTHLVRLTVQGPDPERAARFANAVAATAEDRAGSYYRVFSLRLVDGAKEPYRPVARGEERPYAVAGIVGLFLGVLAAYGVGVLRRT